MLLASAALLAACGGGDATGPGGEPPGCYTLTLGEWSAPHEAVDPPSALRLTTTLGTDGMAQGQTLVVMAHPLRPNPYPWSWWRRNEHGDLELVFTGGYVGITLTLGPSGDDWQGTAQAFTDIAPGLEARASARLDRVACGS
jgi:hypothetical protein